MLILLGLIILTILLVLGGGRVLVERWKKQELALRKKRARLASGVAGGSKAAAASVSKPQPVLSPGSALTPNASLPGMQPFAFRPVVEKPVVLSMNGVQADAYVSELRSQMQTVLDAVNQLQNAYNAWLNGAQAYDTGVTVYQRGYSYEVYVHGEAGWAQFVDSFDKRLLELNKFPDLRKAMLAAQKDIAPAVSAFVAAIRKLDRLIAKCVPPKGKVLPPAVADTRRVAQQIYLRHSSLLHDKNYMNLPKHSVACIRARKPIACPYVPETQEHAQLAAEFKLHMREFLLVWSSCEDAKTVFEKAKSCLDGAVSWADASLDLKSVADLESCLKECQSREKTMLICRDDVLATKAPFVEVVPQLRSVATRLFAIYQRINSMKELTYELAALRYVYRSWVQYKQTDELCSNMESKLVEVEKWGKGTRDPAPPLETIYPLISATEQSLAQAVKACFEFGLAFAPLMEDGVREAAAAVDVSFAGAAKLALSAKPQENEVNACFAAFEQWAAEYISVRVLAGKAQDKLQTAWQMLDAQCQIFFRDFKTLEDAASCKETGIEIISSLLALRRLNRWLTTKHSEGKTKTEQYAKTFGARLKFFDALSVQDETRIADLRKKIRTLGFAFAQRAVAAEKLRKASGARLAYPREPAFPEFQKPADFGQLISGEEAYYAEVDRVEAENARLNQQQSLAREAHSARVGKTSESLAALKATVDALELEFKPTDQCPSLTTVVCSGQLFTLVCAASAYVRAASPK